MVSEMYIGMLKHLIFDQNEQEHHSALNFWGNPSQSFSSTTFITNTDLKQSLETLVVSIVGSPVYRSVAMFIGSRGRAAMLDEGLHESKVAAEGSKVDGGTSLLVLEGGVGSGLEENLSTLLKSISNLRYAYTCTQIEVIILIFCTRKVTKER